MPSPALNLRRELIALTSHLFDYRRVGHDRRWMSFSPSGMVGQGAREREQYWALSVQRGHTVLEISSDGEVTCRLKRAANGHWRGKWLVCERMPVELVPITKLESVSPTTLPASLFVVSLPRSLSSFVYQQMRSAIGLDEPTWTSDGEVLNVDRFKLFAGPTEDTNRKYVQPDSEPHIFYAATDFLDQLIQPFGYAYKDVVQPFVLTAWLKRNSMRILRIRRNIADVALSMLARKWDYPARLLHDNQKLEHRLVRGLLEAEKSLNSLDAETVEFDRMIFDENSLYQSVKRLYGQHSVGTVKYINAKFRKIRQEVLERRKTRAYKRLNDWVKRAMDAKT